MFSIHENYSNNKKGLGHTNIKTPYNLHIRYVDIPDNRLCTHCDNTSHVKEACMDRIKSNQINVAYFEKKKN